LTVELVDSGITFVQPVKVKIKHVCSTTQLLAPLVGEELAFNLSHMHGEPASVVAFPLFTDSVGNSNSPDYCGPRKYNVTTEGKKEVIRNVETEGTNPTAEFIEWPEDSKIYPSGAYSEPSYDFFESEVINTANIGQEQVQLTIDHTDQYLLARQTVKISVELELYPEVTTESKINVILRPSCTETVYGLVGEEGS